jgi:hypothetical protein
VAPASIYSSSRDEPDIRYGVVQFWRADRLGNPWLGMRHPNRGVEHDVLRKEMIRRELS